MKKKGEKNEIFQPAVVSHFPSLPFVYSNMICHLSVLLSIIPIIYGAIILSNITDIIEYSNFNPQAKSICPFKVSSDNGSAITVELKENLDYNKFVCVAALHIGAYGFPACVSDQAEMSVAELCSYFLRFNGYVISSLQDINPRQIDLNFSLTFKSGTSALDYSQRLSLILNSASSKWVPFIGLGNAQGVVYCKAGQFATAILGSYYPGPYYPGSNTFFIDIKMRCSDNTLVVVTESARSGSQFTLASCPLGVVGMSVNLYGNAPFGMKFLCGSKTETQWIGNSDEPATGSYSCPFDQIATGFYQAQGEILDGLGPACSPINLTVIYPDPAMHKVSIVADFSGKDTLLPGSLINVTMNLGLVSQVQAYLAIGGIPSESYQIVVSNELREDRRFTISELSRKKVYLRFLDGTLLEIASKEPPNYYLNLTVAPLLVNSKSVILQFIPFEFSNRQAIIDAHRQPTYSTSTLGRNESIESTAIVSIISTSVSLSIILIAFIALLRYWKRKMKLLEAASGARMNPPSAKSAISSVSTRSKLSENSTDKSITFSATIKSNLGTYDILLLPLHA